MTTRVTLRQGDAVEPGAVDVVTDDEPLGPVDYLVVEFAADRDRPGAAFTFELTTLVDAELIRILDLLIVQRRLDGTVEMFEYEDLVDRAGLTVLEGRLAEVVSPRDVERITAALAPGARGLVLVFENTWAAPLVDAARRSGASVAATGHIPGADLAAALAEPEPCTTAVIDRRARIRRADGVHRATTTRSDIP